jgi:uncharacterized protein DUF5752
VNAAEHPFQFYTAAYLTRIGNQKALNLAEFRRDLESSSDASIFYHTYQSLSRHHFLTEGFSNDFAQWVLAACNRPQLAEEMASLDIRDYVALAGLRADLLRLVNNFCQAHPKESQQAAFEPFFFCEAIEIPIPVGLEARTLREFHDGLGELSHASLYYHFVSSRLRLHLRSNDFSLWLEKELGLRALAERANRIDIYTRTLEGIQARLTALVGAELAK